jgi:hypothetical protein
VWHVEYFAILLNGELCAMFPTPPAGNAFTACKTNTLAQCRVVEATSNCCSQSVGIACWALEDGFAVCSSDFG